jgi:phosphate butyryltransferase
MSLPRFGQLHQRADALASPVPLAVAGAADRTVLEALRVAADRGWVAPILVGVEAEVRRQADEFGIDLEGFSIRDVEGGEAQAFAAVAEVREGRAALLAKGQVATPSLMHAVLDPERGLRSGRVVCQVVLMEIVPQGRRFLMADTGICVKPKLATKVDIVRHAIGVARALGADRPRVAMMAATESANPSMPETVDAVELQRRNLAGEFDGAVIQGPLSFDLAYSSDAGGKKRVEGDVVGSADAMVFPDLLSANLTVKAIMYTADCQFGGVLRGTTAPVAFMSRADTAGTRLNSMALALALVQEAEKDPRP